MPDEGKCSSHCEEGISYAGYDLGKKSVPDLEACFEHCKNNPQAKFLELWNGNCYCKTSDAGRKKKANALACPMN